MGTQLTIAGSARTVVWATINFNFKYFIFISVTSVLYARGNHYYEWPDRNFSYWIDLSMLLEAILNGRQQHQKLLFVWKSDGKYVS